MSSFSQNLKDWRLSKHMTQEDLASQSGISRPNLVAMEQGKRECTLSTLYKLAHTLQITPGTLLDQAPLESEQPLNRHEKDLIARNLLTNTKAPPHLAALQDQVLQEALPLLRAAGIPIKKRITRSSRAQKTASMDIVQEVLVRVRKLFPAKLQGALKGAL